MTLDEARLMANVNARAGRLFEDGYRARWAAPGLLAVRNGRGANYGVDVAAGTCDCPFFLRGGRPCKHVLGWELLLADQRAQWRRLALILVALLGAWADLDDGSSDLDDGSSVLDDGPPAWEDTEPARGGAHDAG